MTVRAGVLALVAAALTVGFAVPLPARAQQEEGFRAQVVRVAFHRDEVLTPYTFELSYPLLTLVYDTLLWRDEEGVPQPWLARAVEASADGRKVTIRLAEGARWHDGRRVTAEDVAFTFRFVASRFHPRFTPQLQAVERIDAPDPATVVVSLRHASPGLSNLALADIPILPAHVWSRLPTTQLAPEGLPMGSGPYRLVEHRPGQSYRFEANAEYFRSPPAVAVIEVPIIARPEETLRALEQARVDVLALSVPDDAVARLRKGGLRVVEGPAYLGTVLMFNLRRPPFDRVELRRAVAQAVNLGPLTQFVGKAVPARQGYVHPESPWASGEPLHTFDAAAARAVLSDPALPRITVSAPDNDPVKLETARQVVVALRTAGAAADVVPVAPDALSQAVGADGSELTFEAAIWVSPPLASYDPDFLYPLFGSDAQRARLNYPGYRSAAFDQIARQVASTTDPAARRMAVIEELRLLADDAPVVPLFFSVGAYAYRPSAFDGWRFVKGSGIIDKLSFVEPRLSPPPPPPPPPRPPPEGGGLSPVAMAAMAAVAGAIVVSLVAVVRRD